MVGLPSDNLPLIFVCARAESGPWGCRKTACQRTGGSKQRLHYLLRDKSLLDITPAFLESVARIDGAIVFDPAGRLLAFGTILHNRGATEDHVLAVAEGGRTTAALGASSLGKVLMVSEDGGISFMQQGRRVWQL